MNRWVLVLGWVARGLALLACGLLVPIHLAAVDGSVLKRAGRNTPSLVERGITLTRENNLGGAQMLLEAARQAELPDRGTLGIAVADLERNQPELELLGKPEPRLETLFGLEKKDQAQTPGSQQTNGMPRV